MNPSLSETGTAGPRRQRSTISARLSWLLAPYHLAALATGAKSFRDNPVLGSPRLNRAGLHVARVRIAHRMVEWRRARLAGLISESDRAALQRDGVVVKRDFLPPAAFAAARREVLSFAGPARQQLQGDTLTRRIALDRPALARLPALRALLDDPEWLGLIRYVGSFQLEPLFYIQTIFPGVCVGTPDPQTRLHADAFHSSVKAWLFLTDVAEDEGPFIYVPGSHRPTRRRLAWERQASIAAARGDDFQAARGSLRVTPATVRRLGLPAPRVFAVPANTLIVADTVGFHARGVSARPTPRVEIWAYGRRNPFLPWLGFDAAAFPLLKGNAVPAFWAALDAAEKLRIGRNPWRAAGVTTPAAPPQLSLHL
ncbi:MAG: phytanoyl-CoA dioxygenase family protein [Alphaproteobacteria bacterium]|nr:phytanoyl-CoA dioxygenase family protein [Alphaproteobacteria bacterium]